MGLFGRHALASPGGLVVDGVVGGQEVCGQGISGVCGECPPEHGSLTAFDDVQQAGEGAASARSVLEQATSTGKAVHDESSTREKALVSDQRSGDHDSVNPLKIVAGDATNPQAKGPKIIAHVCNDLGGWSKGFVLAISRHRPEPEREYRRWHRGRAGNDFALGAVQMVRVRSDIWVANMLAQRGMRTGSGGPPIRYDAVERCLRAVAEHALASKASVHMPRIGCGLAEASGNASSRSSAKP